MLRHQRSPKQEQRQWLFLHWFHLAMRQKQDWFYLCCITKGNQSKNSTSGCSHYGFIWWHESKHYWFYLCCITKGNQSKNSTSGCSHCGLIGEVKQNRIGSICVTSQKEPKARTATVAVLTMVSFGNVTYSGLVPFVLHHPRNQSKNSKMAVLSVVSFGDVTNIGLVVFV